MATEPTPARAVRAARLRRRIRRPPGHWLFVAFCVAVLMMLLLVQGFTVRTQGASRTPTGSESASPLQGDPPVLVERGGKLAGHERPVGRRIALTFDDGPDPRWTPRIAGLLRRERVPATFFLVGAQAVRHPDLVRRLHREGFELANHTFTHVDPASVSGWERDLQISSTDSAIAGIAGVRPRLFRPPYSSTPASATPRQAGAYAAIAREGYVLVLSDLDARDWARPGVPDIVRSATPRGTEGGIVLMHDAGGDRSQTVAALSQLIPRLRDRGFTFVTASELAGVSRATAEPATRGLQRSRGNLLVATLAVARGVTDFLGVALIVIAVLAVLRALALVLFARRHVRTLAARGSAEEYLPPVSILVPAYNEAVGIERAVRSLAGSEYPELEVIVVDDGSDDGTGDLVESLGLERVRVVRQANAGKPAALNRGLIEAAHDILVTVDGDTLFERDTVRHLVAPFRDPAVGAVAGNTKVGNRSGMLGRWQHIEYVMGFNLDRRLYDVLQCMPTVPGAIGGFRRRALLDIGGVSAATLAEDTDITIGIGRAGWRVVYAEDARAWTEAPATLGVLWRQRYRWSYGTMQSIWKHRSAIWSRGEGGIGRRGLPYMVLFQVALPMLAPLIDLFAIYGLLFLDPVPVIGYWVVFNLLQLGLGWYAFRLDKESPRALWAMPLQQFVYRQLMYLVVIESVISAAVGTRIRWQHLERTGDVEVRA